MDKMTVEHLGDRFRCPQCQRVYLDLVGAEDCLKSHDLVYLGGTMQDWKMLWNLISMADVEWHLITPDNRLISNLQRLVMQEPIGGIYLKKRQ